MAVKPRKSKAKKSKRRPKEQATEPQQAFEYADSPQAANPIGRPTKYRAEYVVKVKRWCEEGATDREIAARIGVAESTLYDWKLEYPEFSEAMKPGKEMADDRVERSLYNRAVGYSFDSEKIMHYEGVPLRVPCVEHVPPDVRAATVWLENRRRDKWGPKIALPPPVGPGLTVIIQQAIGGSTEKTVAASRVTVALPLPRQT